MSIYLLKILSCFYYHRSVGAWQCDQVWQFVTILANFRGFWRQFLCPKSPMYKFFDVGILWLEKFIYLLWRQILRFLPKCWWLFCLNTWPHWGLGMFLLKMGTEYLTSLISDHGHASGFQIIHFWPELQTPLFATNIGVALVV